MCANSENFDLQTTVDSRSNVWMHTCHMRILIWSPIFYRYLYLGLHTFFSWEYWPRKPYLWYLWWEFLPPGHRSGAHFVLNSRFVRSKGLARAQGRPVLGWGIYVLGLVACSVCKLGKIQWDLSQTLSSYAASLLHWNDSLLLRKLGTPQTPAGL